MSTKMPRVIGRVGDCDPINEGGVILNHGDGAPTLAYMVSYHEDHGPESERWLIYYALIADIGPDTDEPDGWIATCDGGLVAVESSADMESGDLWHLAHSPRLQDQCAAILAVAGHYGWENFDAYPTGPLSVARAQRIAKKWRTSERTGRPIRMHRPPR